MSSSDRDERSRLLRAIGASDVAHDALLAYNDAPHLDCSSLPDPLELPLSPEPMVEAWSDYVARADEHGALATLRQVIVQLRFPVRQGISQSEAYRAVTLRGRSPDDHAEASGLHIERGDLLELSLHPSSAGPIAVICCRHRADFVALARALAHRNEPVEIPPSQGAVMVAGLNNWDRIARHRSAWQRENPALAQIGLWKREFAGLIKQPALYQDRLILLDDQPYSGVPAVELGLDDTAWRQMSLVIRREHECTHYLTTRLFGGMANNALDEIIADFAGLAAATGRYDADWFLRFVGLENAPRFRAGGRLEIYRGELDDEAFALLQQLVVRAARAIERRCAALDLSETALRTQLCVDLAKSRLELIAEGRF